MYNLDQVTHKLTQKSEGSLYKVCECIGTHARTLEKKRLILIILKFNIVDSIILAYPWSKNHTN